VLEGEFPPLRKWFGEHPDDVLPPLYPTVQGLRGGADEDSDRGPRRPRKPRILENRELVGSERVDVHRIVHAIAEESDMDIDVEQASADSDCFLAADSEDEEDATTRGGPSKPRKRARGRPRKDGSGPFNPISPEWTFFHYIFQR